MLVYIRYFLLALPSLFITISSQAHVQAQKEASQSASIQAIKDSIDTIERHIIAKESYTENLAAGGWTLPVGVRRTVGENTYTVMIESIYTNVRGRYFSASVIMHIPERKEPLYFRATDIPLGMNGIGSNKIPLIENTTIQLNGTNSIELLTENKNTYVEIQCNGSYNQLCIEGKHTFTKIDNSNKTSPQTESFRTQVLAWNDMVSRLDQNHPNNSASRANYKSIVKTILSPNPNEGIFHTWVLLSDTATLDYKIMDEQGETVIENIGSKARKLHTEEFNLGYLPAGIYFLHIIHPSERKIIRFLKE